MAVDRLIQINEALRNELAGVLSQTVDFPSQIVVSVTKVRISPDLHTAAVFLVVTPKDRTGTALALIRKQLSNIVQELTTRVPLRRFPKLRLVVDEGAIRAAHIETLLDSLL